jgi:hypothetical protein
VERLPSAERIALKTRGRPRKAALDCQTRNSLQRAHALSLFIISAQSGVIQDNVSIALHLVLSHRLLTLLVLLVALLLLHNRLDGGRTLCQVRRVLLACHLQFRCGFAPARNEDLDCSLIVADHVIVAAEQA